MSEIISIDSLIFDYLAAQNRRVLGREIDMIFNLDTRTRYAIIERLKKQGYPILANKSCSNGDLGYYVAQNREEVLNEYLRYEQEVFGRRRGFEAMLNSTYFIQEDSFYN